MEIQNLGNEMTLVVINYLFKNDYNKIHVIAKLIFKQFLNENQENLTECKAILCLWVRLSNLFFCLWFANIKIDSG